MSTRDTAGGAIKRCPLCLSTEGPFNYEDALPNWVREYVGKEGPFRAEENGIVTFNRKRPRRFKVPVCEGCNAWMNAEFETPAIDLLKELFEEWSRDLGPSEQLIVARWFSKTTLMLRLHQRALPQLPEPVYTTFRRDGSPPVGMHLWLGTYGKSPPGPETVLTYAPPADLRRLGCFGTIFQIRYLVAQTLQCTLVNVATLPNGAERIGILTEVWPPAIGKKPSPPRLSMNDAMFRAVADRWIV